MAKRASPAKPGATKRKRPAAKPKTKAATGRKAAKGSTSSGSRKRRSSDLTAADALFKLLESPLVAELLAVGATAALAAVAESRFGRKGDEARTAKAAVKAAGKAAAAAIGRRLSSEVEEIRKASKKPRPAAKG